jgi:hypothetical protein
MHPNWEIIRGKSLNKERFITIYKTILLKLKEIWLIINYAKNVMEGLLPSFYIFNGDPIKHDYNTNYRTWTCMHGLIKQSMNDKFLIQGLFVIFHDVNTK